METIRRRKEVISGGSSNPKQRSRLGNVDRRPPNGRPEVLGSFIAAEGKEESRA